MDLYPRLQELRNKLEKLKKAYEHFFAGIERQEPVKLRQEVEKLIRELSRVRIIRTREKYLFQSLCASYSSYSALWDRKLREMLDTSRVEKKLPACAPSAPKKEKPAPSPSASDPFEEAARKYLEAHKKLGIPVKADVKKISELIRKNVEKVKQQYRAKSAAVNVKVENGKVKITVKPIK